MAKWAALLLASCALAADVTSDPRHAFEAYKKQFRKSYATPEEEARRYDVFKAALERIAEGNRRNGAPVFGLTWMSDRAVEEAYKRGRKGKGDTRFLHTAPVYEAPANEQLPEAIDWRLTNAVTPVKNQGQCGSCWAFSAVEEIESQYYLQISDENAATFSPQQVASCTAACDGCGGGDTVTAYQYLQTSPGLASSFFWPYSQGLTPLSECTESECTQSCSSHDLSQLATYEFYIGPAAQVSGFSYATPPCNDACANQNLQLLASAVANKGPVSVCLNAGAWNDYTGGVLTAAGCGGMASADVDHCVQLVGYNTTASTPYWIVRNSWAESWGNDGYIYLQYGQNTCGIADEAIIATLKASPTAEPELLRLRFEKLRRRAMGLAEEEAAEDAEAEEAETELTREEDEMVV